MTIVIVWGTLFSSNRGVNALTRATCDIIRNICPNEKIILIGSGKKEPVSVDSMAFHPMPTIFHLIPLFLKANIFGTKYISTYFKENDFHNVSIVLDLSEGDSFTDIYGILRFISMTLSKLIFMKLTKRYILLPQTIGPFNNKLFENIAASIIRRCEIVVARDYDSKSYAEKISGHDCLFCHDMAFTLIPKRTESSTYRLKGKVGINVSGLLWNGGYTGQNQFNLKIDYPNLMKEITTYFLDLRCEVVFVPHTYGTKSIEDDIVACERLKVLLGEKGMSIEIIKENYSEQELKWIISYLDFFVGSRMHSCIAALSMGVPTIGIAYSRKFKGTFSSIEVGDLVLDPRILDKPEIMKHLKWIYEHNSVYRTRICNIMPQVIATVQETMNHIVGIHL